MMRLALIAAVSTVAGLGACAPLPPSGASYGYGYTGVQSAPAAPYGYNDGGYAPNPYYEQPGYAAPFIAPGPAIIIGGERRYDDRERRYNDRERFRDNRPAEDGFRGGPNRPSPGREYGRDFGGQPGRQNPGSVRPGPVPVSAPRQGPVGPGPGPQRGSPNGHAADFNPGNPTAQGGADR